MFAISQTMYLFEANLNLLTNASTAVAEHHFEQNLTAVVVGPLVLPREKYPCSNIQLQRCTLTNAQCMESQVYNDCTYRQNSISEVLTDDVRLSKYFRFKVNTL